MSNSRLPWTDEATAEEAIKAEKFEIACIVEPEPSVLTDYSARQIKELVDSIDSKSDRELCDIAVSFASALRKGVYPERAILAKCLDVLAVRLTDTALLAKLKDRG